MPAFPTFIPTSVSKQDDQGQFSSYVAQQPPLGQDVAQQAFADYTNSLPPLDATVKDVMQPADPPNGPSTVDSSSRQAFVNSLLPTAEAWAAKTGIPAATYIAWAASEGNWGKAGNALFGVKGSGTAGSLNSPTWEDVNGQRVQTTDNFRDYQNPNEAFQGLWDFLHQNSRYAGALQTLQSGDSAGFLQGINQAGYATDPNWASSVQSIAANQIAPMLAAAKNNILGGLGAATSPPPATQPSSGGLTPPPGPALPAAVAPDSSQQPGGSPQGGIPQMTPATAGDPLQSFSDYASGLGAKLGQGLDQLSTGAGSDLDQFRQYASGLSDKLSSVLTPTSPPQYNDMGGASSSFAETNPAPPTAGSASAIDAATSPQGPQVGDPTATPLLAGNHPLSDLATAGVDALGNRINQTNDDLQFMNDYYANRVPHTPENDERASNLALNTAMGLTEPLENEAGKFIRPLFGDAASGLGHVASSLVGDAGQTASRVLTNPSADHIRGFFHPAEADTADALAGAKAEYLRMYHGTGSAFTSPDALKFDPNGLFGPGYYLTSDARVASSYGEKGVDQVAIKEADSLTAQIQAQQAKVDGLSSTSWQRPGEQRTLDFLQQKLAQVQGGLDAARSGAQVRAVDVPAGLRLLDADAPAPAGLIDSLRQGMPPEIERRFDNTLKSRSGPAITGGDAFGALQLALYDGQQDEKALVNHILAQEGYDGIQYAGGKRVPLNDAAGQPIEHTAVVIFPQSLPKLKNALSGTMGGFVSNATADTGSLLRTAVGSGLRGGVAGGYEASQEPDATPLSVAGGFGTGFVSGAGRGLVDAGLSGKVSSTALAAVGNRVRPGANTPGFLSRIAAPKGWIDELLAPARNTEPEVQAALETFANARLQNAVDAETWGREAKATLGKAADNANAASLFERTSQLAANPTPEQQAFAQRVDAFTQQTGALGRQHGYLSGDVTAGANSPVSSYFPHIYQDNLTQATSAARKSGLSPTDFYSNSRVFPTLDAAAQAGMTPVNSFSAPLQHYAQRIGDSEAKYQFVQELQQASPASAIPYTQGTRLPQGWVPGRATDPVLNGYAFPKPVASAIDNILEPSVLRSKTLGAGLMDALGTGKETLFSLSGFHYLTELRQGFVANDPLRNPIKAAGVVAKAVYNSLSPAAYDAWRLHDAQSFSDAAKAGVTGLAGPGNVLDTEGRLSGLKAGLVRSGVGGLSGGAAGYAIAKQSGADDQTAFRDALIGAGLGALAGPLQAPIQNALWERTVPTLKVMTYGLKTAAGMDPQAAARFTNDTYGGQNLAAIARSKTVQDALRIGALAPDWWESWANQAAGLVKGGDAGKMARGYWLSTAVMAAATLEGLNYAINGHFTDQNEPDHRLDLDLSGLYDQTGTTRRDPKTGAPHNVYMAILPPPIESMLNAATGMGHGDFTTGASKFVMGRAGLIPRMVLQAASNKDFRGQPIVPPYTPIGQAAWNQAANLVGQVAPIGAQQGEASALAQEPPGLAVGSTVAGLPISHPSAAAFDGPVLSDRSRQILDQGNVQWTPAPVSDQIKGIGLTRAERTAWQAAVNDATDKFLVQMAATPSWSRLSPVEKKNIIENALPKIHLGAAGQILRSIPPQEQQARLAVAKPSGTGTSAPFARYLDSAPAQPFGQYLTPTPAAQPFARYR